MRRSSLSARTTGGLALGFGLIVLFVIVVLLVGPKPTRLAGGSGERAAGAADLDMAPLEAAEGAEGTVGRANAGAAVNPITPTGELGGPAGQTPAWGEPAGAPSRVARP